MTKYANIHSEVAKYFLRTSKLACFLHRWEAEYRQWQERYERDMAQASEIETVSTTALQEA